MQIWIAITERDYDDGGDILGLFSTEVKAQEYARNLPRADVEVQEWEVDAETVTPEMIEARQKWEVKWRESEAKRKAGLAAMEARYQAEHADELNRVTCYHCAGPADKRTDLAHTHGWICEKCRRQVAA